MGSDRRLLAAAFAALAFLMAGPARAAVDRPTPTAPAVGATLQFLPTLAWTPVKGADKYEVQVSADAGMDSPVLGPGKDDFLTKNTRATLTQTVPNGTYYWRVRAIGADSSVSPWTAPRPFQKLWTLQPTIQTPSSGASLTFPANPVVLRWSGVAGAAQYLVSVASDPALGSLVFKYQNQDDPNGPPNVASTSAAITAALAPGSYYWGVVPLDAEGNRGVATPVQPFSWVWPSASASTVVDQNTDPEVVDAKLSWNPVPGAARYEVEINPSVDFAPGSKVCCNGTMVATSVSPTTVLLDNTYYWRVRAIDPDGNAGVWNPGPSFAKTFDKGPPSGPVPNTSIKNLHMRDNLTDDTTTADFDQDLSNGYSTRVPLLAWDPVPGAASYEVQVADWSASACQWATADYIKRTAVPEWAPLGLAAGNPVVWAGTLADDGSTALHPGAYCVRVRAESDRAASSVEVWGDYTYLQDGATDSSLPVGPSFDWSAYPDPSDVNNSPGCNTSYLCANDYLLPQTGSVNRRTPFFTWRAVANAQSYFVVVAKDPNFGTIVDEAFTWIPAYAPRNQDGPTTYTDETTKYYWEVLPSTSFSGGSAPALSAGLGAPQDFQKQSLPSTLVYPSAVQVFPDQPRFQWTATEGARRYHLQVASDASFSNLLDDVVTDSTAYSSNTTYPANTILYWRVRADDENKFGLTWSATGIFQKTLVKPTPSPSNPTSGGMLPVWSWGPVQGASSYDVSIDLPNGSHRDFPNLRTPAISFIKMTGTGVFHWRVRAEFPNAGNGETPGPYSTTQTFTRTIGQPVNPHTDASPDHVVLSWDPRVGVKEYKVQIAKTPDFSNKVEDTNTDNTSYAPTMTQFGYQSGGTLYWRVAGVDDDRNQGDWSTAQQIQLLPRMRLSVIGGARHKKKSRITIKVSTTTGSWIGGVAVRVTGPGMKPITKRTNAVGNAVFKLRPKKRGKLFFTATKAGFQPAYVNLRVT
jgi:large repetitive protein